MPPKATFQSTNPADGSIVWSGAAADANDVNAAVSAAQAAFKTWRLLTLEQRLAHVQAFKQKLTENADAMAEIISQETGKILWDSKTEVQGMIGKVDISIRAHSERTGAVEANANGVTSRLQHNAHGVMAVFGPYNFPGHLPNGHIVPALIAGNTVVFKPSDYTPKTAEFTVQLWEQAGLPKGVMNLVQGGRDTGVALAAHDGIDGLLFTGSVETGIALHKQFAGKPEKMLALELGGHNALIIDEVSNIDAAVLTIIQSAFITSGQRCTCARRLILVKNAHSDALLKRLVEVSGKLTLGAYNETPAPFMGPLVSAREAEKVMGAYKQLLADGGKALLEMKQPHTQKAFLTPGIVDVSGCKNIPDAESFGPLLKVYFVDSLEQAVELANHTKYGLSAGLLSDKKAAFDYFAQHIRAGVLAWNRQTTGASSALPFGGVGVSGNHRPSAFYAADYAAYPVAAQCSEQLALPATLPPGVTL